MCVAIPAAGLTAMQTFTVGTAVAGTVMSGVGMYMNQQATNAQMEYQAKINDMNAQTAREEAAYARETAAENEEKHRKQVRGFLGKQRASMAGSGMVVDEGSFLDVTLDTAEGGELDALAIRHEGELEAWRAEIGAANYEAQANLNRASTSSPFMAAAPSLLTGAGNIGMNYYRLKQ